MTLAFVTSLRHPDNSAHYPRIEELLGETLRSVSSQSNDDFMVFVVGNRRPSVRLPSGVVFVEVDFPASEGIGGHHAARDRLIIDKGTKIGAGLLAARAYDPTHVMIFDADDFVSRNLVAFVKAGRPDTGWAIDKGWMYSRVRNSVRPIDDFFRRCGTSFIMPYEAYAVPEHLGADATQAEIVAGFGERLHKVLGAHRDARQWFEAHGFPVKDLPFRGAVYQVDTGENHSGRSLVGIATPVSSGIRAEFSVPNTKGRLATLWAGFGPGPIVETLPRVAARLAPSAFPNPKRRS